MVAAVGAGTAEGECTVSLTGNSDDNDEHIGDPAGVKMLGAWPAPCCLVTAKAFLVVIALLAAPAIGQAMDLPRCYYESDDETCRKAVNIIVSHPNLPDDKVSRLIRQMEEKQPGFFDQPLRSILIELLITPLGLTVVAVVCITLVAVVLFLIRKLA